MDEPSVDLHLPDGSVHTAGPDAIVGRSSAATVRIDDPRVSTVHAELSWREEGFLLIARGGRLRVGGRNVRDVVLRPGLQVELAPAVVMRVGAIHVGHASVVPPTAGRDALRFVVREGTVAIHRGRAAVATVVLSGVNARALEALLRAGEPVRWDTIAEEVWPEEGVLRARSRTGGPAGPDAWGAVDERRLRNRWDQALRALRRSLEAVGRDTLLEVAGGTVAARLSPGDTVDA